MGKILDRIQKIASNEGITIGALERKIGASKGVLSRAINNSTDIQAKWIECLVDNYPQYSTRWLITGQGDMITDASKVKATRSEDGKGIPLIPVSAIAGFPADGWGEQFLDGFERYHIPEFENKGADFLIRVSGDSMTPLYYSGDLLACHKIADIRFFQWGSIYVLETSQGVIVKRVMPADEHDDCILCTSENCATHKPFLLPKDDIRSLSTIIGLVRLV